MSYFVGILDGAKEVWGVRIPDFSGCVGGGSTAEAAIADAIIALRDVAAHCLSQGIALPKPSTIAEIISSGEMQKGESTVMIPLLLDEGRSVRANVTFDAGLLHAIDEAADARGVTRSAFLASAARDKIIQSA